MWFISLILLAGCCLKLDWRVHVFFTFQLFWILVQTFATWFTFSWLERILLISNFQGDSVWRRLIRVVFRLLDDRGAATATIAAVPVIQPLEISKELCPDVGLLGHDWFLFNCDVVLPFWACKTKPMSGGGDTHSHSPLLLASSLDSLSSMAERLRGASPKEGLLRPACLIFSIIDSNRGPGGRRMNKSGTTVGGITCDGLSGVTVHWRDCAGGEGGLGQLHSQ